MVLIIIIIFVILFGEILYQLLINFMEGFKMKKKKKIIEVFVSDDGKEFNDKESCIKYEQLEHFKKLGVRAGTSFLNPKNTKKSGFREIFYDDVNDLFNAPLVYIPDYETLDEVMDHFLISRMAWRGLHVGINIREDTCFMPLEHYQKFIEQAVDFFADEVTPSNPHQGSELTNWKS